MTTAAVSTPALVTWVLLALVLGLAAGATAATLVARRPGGGAPPPADLPPAPAPGTRPALEVDDLPGFLEHPPGSPAPAPAATTAPTAPTAPPAMATAASATASPAGATAVRPARRKGGGRHSPAALSARSTLVAMAVAAAVLVLVAVVIALVGRDDAARDGSPASSPPAAASDPAEETEVAALSARATFGTVLLERRRVGVTVTRPDLTVSSDGTRARAHVLLPTYNCLLPEPPPDPEAAGCAPAATEYADLTGADLRLTRDGDRFELAGRLATYTQPPRGPAAHTGRSYPLGVTLTADGPQQDGTAPARGLLRLGTESTATTGDAGANVLTWLD